MMRSSTRAGALELLVLAAGALLARDALAQATATVAGPGRFVDMIEVTDHEDQVDITVIFTCSMRYITHLPPADGQELRIELQPLPDCGTGAGAQIAGELPPISGGGKIISAARVESDVPAQVTLVLSWRKVERFVLAQGVDPRGMRIRLIDRARGRGKIIVSEPADHVSNYAINLDSQPTPFDDAVIKLASERLKTPAYVSQATVDGDRWYRLRIGPIAKRSEAERMLALAQADYPRAWLAVGDDQVTSDPNAVSGEGPLPPVERIGTDPALDPATLQKTLGEARAALAARDYPKAITLLTKLQRQPEFPDRARAQELLGLARERSGQLAHAKAEYEEYLRRYPKGDAAERIVTRLHALRLASARPRTRGGAAGQEGKRWAFSGGVAQLFRYDGTHVDSTAPPGASVLPASTQVTSQNSLYNDVDLLGQRRGERFDVLTRLSAGYAKSFIRQPNADTKRVSVASIEISDRSLGWLARVGRQARNQDGVLGTFDGLFASYQWRPAWSVNLAAGYPVERTDATLRTDRQFETLSVGYAPPGKHWDASLFAAAQRFQGVRDRQAVGLELRLLQLKRSLLALVDYDTHYQSLNAVTLIGTVQLPSRWAMSLDLERRNSPVITTRNALIGQPVTTIAELEQVFTLDQIFQLARDRTPVTSNYSITATRPISERFQFSAAVSATRSDATIASGGVDAQPATGLDLTYQMQLYGSSVWRAGDFNVLSLAYSNTEVARLYGLGITSRFPLKGAWRLGPRLEVDRREIASDGSTELVFVPSLLIDYQRDRRLLQFEVGGQLGKRSGTLQTQDTRRYYVSLAYRIAF
jgi:tetratricopeptide (TPR) repeat protein